MHGQDIAIKWIKKPRSCDDEDTFKWWLRQVIMELQCQVKFPAENVMPLMAVSLDLNFEERPCFVSPLMRNGSLSDRLRPTGEWKKLPILNWDQRVNIAKGKTIHVKRKTRIVSKDSVF